MKSQKSYALPSMSMIQLLQPIEMVQGMQEMLCFFMEISTAGPSMKQIIAYFSATKLIFLT